MNMKANGAGRPRPRSDERTSPGIASGLAGGRKGGRWAARVLASAVAVAICLAPGIALGSMYRSTFGDREPLPRRPVRAFDRVQGPSEAGQLFQRQCVACHGKKGKGDGPAAPAMTPRPADLTDAERIGELSDEELFEVIANGRKAMPAFAKLLEPEEIRAMVRYLRELSDTGDDGQHEPSS